MDNNASGRWFRTVSMMNSSSLFYLGTYELGNNYLFEDIKYQFPSHNPSFAVE